MRESLVQCGTACNKISHITFKEGAGKFSVNVLQLI
jgi:hypothetical protein